MEQIEHIPHEDGCWLLAPQRLRENLLVNEEFHFLQVGHGELQPVAESLVDGGGVAVQTSRRNARAKRASPMTVGHGRFGPDRVPRKASCLAPGFRSMRPFD